jgi:hypothetical protein
MTGLIGSLRDCRRFFCKSARDDINWAQGRRFRLEPFRVLREAVRIFLC